MRRTAILNLLCFTMAYAADPPCATRQNLAGSCFKVYGALRLYNGTPSARITVSSTKRVLGVVSYIADNNETFAAPANVRSNASFDRSLNGTYFVCPITKAQPREMQRVCIEAADFTSDGKGK